MQQGTFHPQETGAAPRKQRNPQGGRGSETGHRGGASEGGGGSPRFPQDLIDTHSCALLPRTPPAGSPSSGRNSAAPCSPGAVIGGAAGGAGSAGAPLSDSGGQRGRRERQLLREPQPRRAREREPRQRHEPEMRRDRCWGRHLRYVSSQAAG
ncbi:SAP30-binding protein [Platysternon megacephalum]|uniref:SAP30-binding protein n=1 Tax=Platysternon megacephalum TaxID=55544 RepID=A0A4D9E3Z6_9SAUR|nr:SAP30-binding protein [Platysternon megacephalum]